MSRTVNARHALFAKEYVLDHNATRAYKAAGYKVKSDDVAGAAASRLLADVRIQELVSRFEAEAHKRLEITKEKIEREIASMAFVDIRDFYDDDGNIKSPKEWTREMAAAVASIEVFEEYQGVGKQRTYIGRTKKLKLWPKLEANVTLGAPHGIGVKKLEVGNPGDFDKSDLNAIKRRVAERAARLGIPIPAEVLKLPHPAVK